MSRDARRIRANVQRRRDWVAEYEAHRRAVKKARKAREKFEARIRDENAQVWSFVGGGVVLVTAILGGAILLSMN